MKKPPKGFLRSGSFVFECPHCEQSLVVKAQDFYAGNANIAGMLVTCVACKKQYGIENVFKTHKGGK